MSTGEIFNSVLTRSRGYSMGSLWQSLDVELTGSGRSFKEQTGLFFSLLSSLLRKGEIRLALDGQYIEGELEEQLQGLRLVWPISKHELDEDMGLWFLVSAPAGIVWIASDGPETWT